MTPRAAAVAVLLAGGVPLAAQQPDASGPWVFLACDYPDVNADFADNVRYTLERSGGLREYFAAISFGQFRDSGSMVVDSVPLPHARTTYAAPLDQLRLVSDCVAAADDRVYFPDYFGILVQTNAPTATTSVFTSGFRMSLAVDGVERQYGIAFISGDDAGSVRTYAHEMGHGMGMGHAGVIHAGEFVEFYSYWDIMGARLVQLGAGYMDRLGWLPPGRKLALPADSVGFRSLELVRLADPPPLGILSVDIPLERTTADSAVSYTIEARRRVGWDHDLPGDGVLVRQTVTFDSTWIYSSVVARTADDGSRVPLGQEAFRPGDRFTDSIVGLFVTVDSLTADGYGVGVTRGWPVTVTADGPGTVTGLPGTPTCTGLCRAVFPTPGSTVALAATPATNETFAGWVGDCTGTGSCTVVATSARRVTAIFAAPLAVVSEVLPPAAPGTEYVGQLAASHAGAHWTIDSTAGPLPPGLTLDSVAGTITGMPTRFGRFALAVTAEWKGLAADATVVLPVLRPDVPPEYLMDGLLGALALPETLRTLLDDSGNHNGVYDLGDFRSWVLAEP